jgi:hypothetical protein
MTIGSAVSAGRKVNLREHFKILTHSGVRDPSTERKIIELNRERVMYGFMLAGAILLLVAILW